MRYVAFLTQTYLRSTGGRRAPEGVHGGKVLGLYGRWRTSTGSAVGVAGEALVHLPAGTDGERNTCRYRRERGVTCSVKAAAHTTTFRKKVCSVVENDQTKYISLMSVRWSIHTNPATAEAKHQ